MVVVYILYLNTNFSKLLLQFFVSGSKNVKNRKKKLFCNRVANVIMDILSHTVVIKMRKLNKSKTGTYYYLQHATLTLSFFIIVITPNGQLSDED